MGKTKSELTRRRLYFAWAVLYVLCAGLGFVPEPGNLARAVLFLLSAAFFIPPALLLHQNGARDRKIVRYLSAVSLTLTLILLLLNIRSALAGAFVGNFLHAMLVVLSAPMIASNFWAASLFGWACLLIASFRRKKDKKENS